MSLVERVDRAARKLGTTRSAFTRDALRETLTRLTTVEKERRHRRGYQALPVERGARGRLGARITTLDSRRLDEIREALLFALGF